MAGRMGGGRVTTTNLEIVGVDAGPRADPGEGRDPRSPRRRGRAARLGEDAHGRCAMSTTGLLRGPVKKDRPAALERSVERRDASGAVLGTVALEPTIFGIEPNLAVLHQVVTAQLAAKRAGTQSTKTRAEVRGGGAKPYRQKGTGHARQGSIRAPHYVGGGVAFAPEAPLLRPAHPQEDGAPGAALRALGPRERVQGRPPRRLLVGGAEDARRRHRCSTRSGSTAPCSSCSRAATASRRARCATSRGRPRSTPASSTPTTCSPTTGCCSPTRRCRPPIAADREADAAADAAAERGRGHAVEAADEHEGEG